jgi:6-phosphogluconolactonase
VGADNENILVRGARITRRSVIAASGALAVARAWPSAAEQARPASREMLAYVGTYTPNGEGIYLCNVNLQTGALSVRKVFKDIQNPSWLALAPNGQHLYALSEIDNYGGGKNGSVTAFAVDRENGELTRINTVSSQGSTPAHLSVHPSGEYVLVANYFGGSVAVLPIQSNGGLGEATDVHVNSGPLNPPRAADDPPGNFAPSDHSGPRVHMVEADPTGRFVIANDAGLDQTFIFTLDLQSGKLSPAETPSVAAPPGSAPRHFVFHPNGRFFYNLHEQDSMLAAYDYDSRTGRMTAKNTVSILPRGFAGSNLASELAISHDGRFLYAGNRLHDTIAIISVRPDGRVEWTGEEWVRADYPRSFAIDPAGNFLFSCNQRGDSITAFRIDRQSGRLRFTGEFVPIGSPVNLTFLT